ARDSPPVLHLHIEVGRKLEMSPRKKIISTPPRNITRPTVNPAAIGMAYLKSEQNQILDAD
ncbi:unnamed protein product, partial [Ilex paraguariensis]